MKKRLFSIVLGVVAAAAAAAFAVSCGTESISASTSESESIPAPTSTSESATVKYTVTFLSDGAETTAEVEEGQSVARPADPVKSGYTFVNWYSDPSFGGRAYNFATPVNQDVTLYARFVETVTENDYDVVYYDGEEKVAAAKTVQGVAYDLPEIAAPGFLGWWTSDYNDGEKLTAKYDGGEITAHTAMYAVYSGATPAVSVDDNGVSWNAVRANVNYKVTVVAPDKSVTIKDTTATSLAYDFANKPEGDYEITVAAGANVGKAYYRNKSLARVCLFDISEGVVSFRTVANAERYFITVVCDDDGHDHTDVEITVEDGAKVAAYDFSGCKMPENGISFTVKAVAAGYADSVSDAYVYSVTLGEAAPVIDVDANVVEWAEVDGADHYVVAVTSGGKIDEYVVYDTYYPLGAYTGSISVTVKPVSDLAYSVWSAAVTADFDRLVTPTVKGISGETLTWNEVDGAASYNVMIGDSTVSVDRACYTITQPDVTVYVQAVSGNDEKDDSAWSDGFYIATGTGALNYDKGVVSWNAVYGARKYHVYVNGEEVAEITDGSTSYVPDYTRSGSNVISVCCETKDEILERSSIEIAAYGVMFDTEGGADEDRQYYARGDVLRLPEPYKYGYVFSGWYDAQNGGRRWDSGVYNVGNDVVLYAKWTPARYTVKLNVTGGDEDSEEIVVTYGETYSMPVPVSDDPAVAFAGWYSMVNAEGVRFTDEKGFAYSENGGNTWQNANIDTVYAGWVEVFKFNEISGGTAYSVSKGRFADKFLSVTVPTMYKGKYVTTVEGSAFQGLKNLVGVEIPDTIQLVETGTAFLNCTSLMNITVYETTDKNKGPYSSYDGMLVYNNQYNGMELKYFPLGRTGDVYIPDAVETLPTAVFKSSDITKIYIPASVTSINANAFYLSRKLAEIVFLPAANGTAEKPLTIAENAFRSCTSLTSVTFPARLASFSTDIFTGCVNLAEVNVNGAGDSFSSKDGVLCNGDGDEIIYCPVNRAGAYVFPVGINSVADGAFSGCTKITSVVVPANVTSIGKNAFNGCTGILSLTFEGSKDDYDLTIGESAFAGCNKIESVVLPANLKTLRTKAFADTTKLATVTVNAGDDVDFANAVFGNIVTLNIGADFGLVDINGVFGGDKLANVYVDENNANYSETDGVIFDVNRTRIVYYPAAKTGEYVIPETVTVIGANVFEKKKLTKVTINNKVTSIGDNAFNASDVATVVFEDGGDAALTIGASAFKGSKISAVTIPSRVASIGASAFENCTSLTTVELAGVTDVAAKTFSGCTKLTAVTIPEGVVSIGDSAFAKCAALTSVTIPASAEVLYTVSNALQVFDGCTKLATVNVADGNARYASVSGMLYKKNAEGVADTLVLCPIANNTDGGNIVIPATVKAIMNKAFASNKGIKNLSFENNTVAADFDFGQETFSGCTGLVSVTLPSGMTKVGAFMFNGCTGLTSVTIPNTVTLLENGAFMGCTKLTSVNFEEGGEAGLELADGASSGTPPKNNGVFVGCTALASVALPERTTKIGACAFASIGGTPPTNGASGLTSIAIPANVTSIGAYAFFNATKLAAITFGNDSRIESIGNFAFNGTVLTSFTVKASLKSIGQSAFASVTKMTSLLFDEDSVLETIGSSAFSGCSGISGDVVIPASVKQIGTSAFLNAKAIKSVTFGNGSELQSIGNNAFAGTTFASFAFPETEDVISVGSNIFSTNGAASTLNNALKSVYISKNVLNVTQAFAGCSAIEQITVSAENNNISLDAPVLYSADGRNVMYVYPNAVDGTYEIPYGIEEIGDYCLDGQTKITKLVIPATVKTIGRNAFHGCTSLKTVEFASGSQLEIVGVYLFENCTALESIELPVNGKFTDLPNYMFNGCTSLKNITIPEQITSIGRNVFSGTSVETIVIPEKVGMLGTNISNGSVFSGCTSLKNIVLPDGMTLIGSETFKDCTSLASIALPESLGNIGPSAFEGCTNLKDIVIPQGVSILGNGTSATSNCYVFRNCTSLEEITFLGNIRSIGKECFANCTSLKSIDLGNALTNLGDGAFKNSGLESVVIPGTLATIYNNAFTDCKSLASVTISDGVKVINANAFANCEKLTKFSIPASVQTLGGGVISGCDNIETIAVDQGNLFFKVSIEGIIFTLEDALVYCPSSVTGEVVLEDGATLGASAFLDCDKITKIVLPSDLTAIPNNAFQNCASLTEVVIPETVTAIGDYAFSGCGALTDVVLPSGLLTIGRNTFEKCASLVKIDIPASLEILGYSNSAGYVFSDCTSLAEVTLHEGLKSIAGYTFQNCISLVSLGIPSTVTYLGASAFNSCKALRDVNLPDSITTFGAAFRNCASIASITVPSKVTSLAANTFNGCTSLKTLVLPNGLKTIGANALTNCTAIESLTIPSSVTTITASALTGWTSAQTIYVSYKSPNEVPSTASILKTTPATVVYAE